jgi:hypothetical protein
LPPLPTPPGGPSPETFDFTKIDTPSEALVMPGADMLTNLLIASSPSRRGKVTVECNNQKLDYTLSQSGQGASAGCSCPCDGNSSIPGNINGQPFTVGMKNIPGISYIRGNTPSGPLAETIQYLQGSATSAGTAGNMDFNQTFVLDPTSAWTGHFGMWSGTMGPRGTPATQGFGVDINKAPDGNGYILNGYMGDKPMTGSIKNLGPNLIAMDRTVGANTIHQLIQLG